MCLPSARAHMNKNFHRVIFNAVRGQRMVVQETATSTGKGRNRASAGTGEGQRPWVLRGLVAALALIGWLPVGHAQIVPNPLALPSQRPQTLVAPNGVPLVNITTPSAGGVSVNHYSQFDVGAPGAILNNSRTPVQSQLGGYIQGNPWLATGPARIIVNQVASSNPSYLNGYIEVAGQRAEVIIANPSGISVNGGGFINASRVTLTTGTPQYGLGGSLDGYVVNGGTVTVDGKGLDLSTTDYAAKDSDTKYNELKGKDPAEAAKWAEGGEYRVALHAAAGALSGGVAGALGAGASAALMSHLADAIGEMHLSLPVAQALAAVTATAIGGIAGGAAGATSAYNVELNNRQLHPSEIKWIQEKSAVFAEILSEKLGHPVTEAEATMWLTLAGQGDVDKYDQTTISNNLGSYASDEYVAYIAAKSFINQSARTTFVDSFGRTQTLFSATAPDFNNPLVYSQYKNDAAYRDFYWNTLQINLKPDNPTAAEQQIYDQRQQVVYKQTLTDLALAGVSLAGGGAIKYVAGKLVSVPTSGGVLELFTDERGPQVTGALGVGPKDPKAVAGDARSMPNIASNSQSTVIANNPNIPRSEGGTNSMMDFLPEAARVVQPGGTIVINGNDANRMVTQIPSVSQLDELGLSVVYSGDLLPQYSGLTSRRTDGSPISATRTVVFVKKPTKP